ncbi:chorismate--pyruvate lyase family protein [Crenothrix polyspora]|uniref:Probable chorismate pyruvate-lyase n=1 Tax=Crenothrix polyspora TaxID=360316 RepID=A0A1R4HB16_9GAMM|nr:chorismate lyase [Crenothrix polyspora]SJM93060.1 putative chorismate pyruvate-lyase [Crenothrix polyspora]
MAHTPFLLAGQPVWLENRPGIRQHMPGNIQAWVYETGSLTQRLRQRYGASVAVRMLFHRWATPSLSERRLLAVPEHRYALVREVMLHANGKPLLLARTIIPEATLKGAHRNLSHLGTRPLGEVIFSYPKLERLAMEVTLIPATSWSPSAIDLAGINQSIWGRRTVYAVAGRAMLVSEFFLPEIL